MPTPSATGECQFFGLIESTTTGSDRIKTKYPDLPVISSSLIDGKGVVDAGEEQTKNSAQNELQTLPTAKHKIKNDLRIF
jgi:hypothetical protein